MVIHVQCLGFISLVTITLISYINLLTRLIISTQKMEAVYSSKMSEFFAIMWHKNPKEEIWKLYVWTFWRAQHICRGTLSTHAHRSACTQAHTHIRTPTCTCYFTNRNKEILFPGNVTDPKTDLTYQNSRTEIKIIIFKEKVVNATSTTTDNTVYFITLQQLMREQQCLPILSVDKQQL
jgi:hypothetical protein